MPPPTTPQAALPLLRAVRAAIAFLGVIVSIIFFLPPCFLKKVEIGYKDTTYFPYDNEFH
ncbi:MAG: hypothetical protein IJ200_10125 [Prevotella sp.]|nr:hypothetical protein [Prevotella sp.]